jgi:hypothetical protein
MCTHTRVLNTPPVVQHVRYMMYSYRRTPRSSPLHTHTILRRSQRTRYAAVPPTMHGHKPSNVCRSQCVLKRCAQTATHLWRQVCRSAHKAAWRRLELSVLRWVAQQQHTAGTCVNYTVQHSQHIAAYRADKNHIAAHPADVTITHM